MYGIKTAFHARDSSNIFLVTFFTSPIFVCVFLMHLISSDILQCASHSTVLYKSSLYLILGVCILLRV
jgi:hypothetical protein